MPSVKFYLKNNKKKETLISLSFRYDKKRLFMSTGMKVQSKYWDNKKQRVKKTNQYPQYKSINANLEKLDSIVHNAYNWFLLKEENPNVDQLKKKVDEIRGLRIKSKITFLEYFQLFYDELLETNRVAKARIRAYKSTMNYCNHFNGNFRKIDWIDIDYEFSVDFTQYLYDYTTTNSQNTVVAHLTRIRAVMNRANEKEYTDIQKHKSKKFLPKEVITTKTYLTINELTDLFYLDLSNNKRLEKVRDWFIISCFTALRFSDTDRLKKEHIFTSYDKNNKPYKLIRIMQGKTEGNATIPLHPYVEAIIDKYGGEIPKPISNQKTNDYLKELCEMAGITQNVVMKKNHNGRNYEIVQKKCDTISSHTGRRSGASILYIAGVQPRSIMKLTGHKKLDSFLRYIRVTDEENAVMIAKSSVFNVKLRKVS